MDLSGKNKTALPSAKGRPFSERFMSSVLPPGPVRINTDSILVFPALDQEYQVISLISTGGTALVSVAEDRFLKRTVALKSLREEHLSDPVRKRAFIREAQLMAQLEHPSIVPVYGIAGDSAGGLHIIMKQIQGISLKTCLKNLREQYAGKRPARTEERKSLHDRIEWFIRVCDAVAFAHSKRVLHGDLKPGNIMIENFHDVYVMDWGNAEIMKDDLQESLNDTISGTPGYLAPEVVRGEAMDYRSEVFSLGLILFEIVTLSKAVTGKTSREILLKIMNGKRSPIRHRFGAMIQPVLRGILKKALHPLREKRYQTVSELAEELRNYLVLFSCKDPAPAAGKSSRKKITSPTGTD